MEKTNELVDCYCGGKPEMAEAYMYGKKEFQVYCDKHSFCSDVKDTSKEAITSWNNNQAKNILVEFADEQLKLISKAELEEIEQSAEEFDGFTGMRVVGRLEKLVSEKFAGITIFSTQSGYSIYLNQHRICGNKPDLNSKQIYNNEKVLVEYIKEAIS